MTTNDLAQQIWDAIDAKVRKYGDVPDVDAIAAILAHHDTATVGDEDHWRHQLEAYTDAATKAGYVFSQTRDGIVSEHNPELAKAVEMDVTVGDAARKALMERAWDLARTIAVVDKQLLSSDAVKAIADLAQSAISASERELVEALEKIAGRPCLKSHDDRAPARKHAEPDGELHAGRA